MNPWAFLRRHRTLAAALAAAYALWRYGRYLAVGWLQLRNVPFVDGPVQFLLEHWEVAGALGAMIFIAVFASVRYALGKASRNSGREAVVRPEGEPESRSPSDLRA